MPATDWHNKTALTVYGDGGGHAGTLFRSHRPSGLGSGCRSEKSLVCRYPRHNCPSINDMYAECSKTHVENQSPIKRPFRRFLEQRNLFLVASTGAGGTP